jgi:hypothetical protein
MRMTARKAVRKPTKMSPSLLPGRSTGHVIETKHDMAAYDVATFDTFCINQLGSGSGHMFGVFHWKSVRT